MTKAEKRVIRAAMGWFMLPRHNSVDLCGYAEFKKLMALHEAVAALSKRRVKRD